MRTALALCLLLGGCATRPVELAPMTRAPDFIPHRVLDADSGAVFGSNTAIGGARLTVEAIEASTGAPVIGAVVSVIGPTPAWGTTVSHLDLTLQPLEPGTYAVRVAAPGHVPALATGIVLGAQEARTLSLALALAPDRLTGQVVGPGGPIAGARLSMGDSYAFSDATGAFALDGVPSEGGVLGVAKTGFAALTRTVGAAGGLGELDLVPHTPVVSFDNPTTAFAGTTAWESLSALRASLAADGMAIASNSATADIRVLVCPKANESASLEHWVAEGGKLVILGEWGGFGGGDPRAANALLAPFGLALASDQLRSSAAPTASSWPTLTSLSSLLPRPWPASSVKVFDAGSVFSVPPAFNVLSTGTAGFRIATVLGGDWAVVAARPYHLGLVVAVGDTSAWATPASGTSTSSNLQAADNEAFVRDLMRW